MNRFANILAQINIVLMVGGFVVASLLYSTNIFLRFFSVAAITWIDKVTGYLFAITPLLGSALAIRSEENIKIDILTHFVKSGVISLLAKAVGLMVSLLFLGLFFRHFSIEWSREVNELGFIRQWMLDIPYIFFFFSGSCFFLEAIIAEVSNFKLRKIQDQKKPPSSFKGI